MSDDPQKPKMTVQDVEAALARIRQVAADGDNEAAHVEEDDLRYAVLAAIADGTCEDPVVCARLALTSKAIKFLRWHL